MRSTKIVIKNNTVTIFIDFKKTVTLLIYYLYCAYIFRYNNFTIVCCLVAVLIAYVGSGSYPGKV